MRLRSWAVLITALLTATTAMAGTGYPPRTGGKDSNPRWYGYYANNGSVPANADHTNITEVWATTANTTPRSDTTSWVTNTITKELAIDAQYGIRAMVDVGAIVFLVGSSNGVYPCYYNNPNAAAEFQGLVQTLINDGYLVPNAPQFGTVSSFYVADEPDRNCLRDDNNGTIDKPAFVPNSALLNAISAIRQNANTTNFPLATIVTVVDYPDMKNGLGLFDWVGMDDYAVGTTDYLNDFAVFESRVKSWDVVGGTTQYYFLVPNVASGTPQADGAPYLQAKFLADNYVVGIMPFRWDDGKGGGMVGTSWAPSYIALGKWIVSYNSPGPTVVVDNFAILH